MSFFFFFFILSIFPIPAGAFTDEEVVNYQSVLKDRPMGEKIALWSERFVGTPYDQDPRGEYVTRRVIVADERVDCMYLTFRSVELALSDSPSGAVDVALDKRFHARGVLKDGLVANYEDRFEYGEDMIDSGKWGREVTAQLGRTTEITGARGTNRVSVLATKSLKKEMAKLKSGDVVFFIRKPARRIRDEVVGHIGTVKVETGPGRASVRNVFLVHAGGTKAKGGAVKKVLLADYLRTMPYIGARVTRF